MSRNHETSSSPAEMLQVIQDPQFMHHVSARKRRAQTASRIGQLNLTSMLDVIFLLLIFFILTANFSANEGILPANLPTGPQSQTPSEIRPPTQPLMITLLPLDNDLADIWVTYDQNTVHLGSDFGALYETLAHWRYDSAANAAGIYLPDNPIVIKPERGVKWQPAVDAFNACIRARYEKIRFAESDES